MSTAVVIRYETEPDRADDNQRLVERVFAELAIENPAGLRYASFRDGTRFMHVAVIDAEPNPLDGIKAFGEFQAGIGDRLTGPPERTTVTLVGSYGFPPESEDRR